MQRKKSSLPRKPKRKLIKQLTKFQFFLKTNYNTVVGPTGTWAGVLPRGTS